MPTISFSANRYLPESNPSCVTSVPDLDELSSPDPGDWISEKPQGGASDFIIFTVAASLLIAFSFLNLYSLPLGTVSVGAVFDNAASIYGSDVEVYGIISHTNDIEFTLADANSTAVLDVVWLSGTDLPLNGSRIIATGQIVEGTAGPAMMCHSFSVKIGAITSYENPFTLPSLRILSSVIVWFAVMMLSTAAITLANLRKRAENIKRIIMAMTDICTVSSGIMTASMIALICLEPSLENSADLFAYCAGTAFILLLASSLSRNSKHADIREISNALPMIAAILTLLGLLLSLLIIPAAQAAALFSEVSTHYPDSAFATVLGASGLICLGAYMARRKFELSAIEGSLAAKMSEVR